MNFRRHREPGSTDELQKTAGARTDGWTSEDTENQDRLHDIHQEALNNEKSIDLQNPRDWSVIWFLINSYWRNLSSPTFPSTARANKDFAWKQYIDVIECLITTIFYHSIADQSHWSFISNGNLIVAWQPSAIIENHWFCRSIPDGRKSIVIWMVNNDQWQASVWRLSHIERNPLN